MHNPRLKTRSDYHKLNTYPAYNFRLAQWLKPGFLILLGFAAGYFYHKFLMRPSAEILALASLESNAEKDSGLDMRYARSARASSKV